MKGHCRANKFRKAAVCATQDCEETVDQKNNNWQILWDTQSRQQIAIIIWNR